MFNSPTTLEWFAVFSFVAFAVVYFLVPAMGYQREDRGMLLASLYSLLGYGVLTLLQLGIQYLAFLVSDGRSGGSGMIHVGYIFGGIKLVVFLVSQGLFVLGLKGLKR
jgi:hypothetical protein